MLKDVEAKECKILITSKSWNLEIQIQITQPFSITFSS